MKTIFQLIAVIALLVIAYVFYQNRKQPLPTDTTKFEKAIDSLRIEIEKDKQKMKSYDSTIEVQNQKIKKLNKKLAATAEEANQEQKAHEEDIKRINSMSRNAVAAEFTDLFK